MGCPRCLDCQRCPGLTKATRATHDPNKWHTASIAPVLILHCAFWGTVPVLAQYRHWYGYSLSAALVLCRCRKKHLLALCCYAGTVLVPMPYCACTILARLLVLDRLCTDTVIVLVLHWGHAVLACTVMHTVTYWSRLGMALVLRWSCAGIHAVLQ